MNDRDPTDIGLSVVPDDQAPHACIGGWVETITGRPAPCQVCKPHLQRDSNGHWRVTKGRP